MDIHRFGACEMRAGSNGRGGPIPQSHGCGAIPMRQSVTLNFLTIASR
jgi:hypothetical protein